MTLDDSGAATVAGFTRSSDFPTVNAYDSTFNGGYWHAFVARLGLTETGTDQLVYSTYLGGNGDDLALTIALDGPDAMDVAGYTTSSDFPTTEGSYQPTPIDGEDGFVSRLDLTQLPAQQLTDSTLLGGTGNDRIETCAFHAPGVITLAGVTDSCDFPTTQGAFDETCNPNPDPEIPGNDVFVTRFTLSSQLPPHVLVVLDRSGSMRRTRANNHTRC